MRGESTLIRCFCSFGILTIAASAIVWTACGSGPKSAGSADGVGDGRGQPGESEDEEAVCQEFERYIEKYFPDDTQNPRAARERIDDVASPPAVALEKAHLSHPVGCAAEDKPFTHDNNAACNDNFFPPRTLGFHVKVRDICRRAPPEWWKAESAAVNHLKRWGEPSLSGNAPASAEIYRLLIASPGEVSTVVRVEKNGDGVFMLSKYCTCNPSRDRDDRVEARPLSKAQWRRFRGLIDKAGFWDAAVQVNRIRRNGVMWLLEGRREGQYHLVERTSPDVGYFRRAGEYLLALAGAADRDAYCCLESGGR